MGQENHRTIVFLPVHIFKGDCASSAAVLEVVPMDLMPESSETTPPPVEQMPQSIWIAPLPRSVQFPESVASSKHSFTVCHPT